MRIITFIFGILFSLQTMSQGMFIQNNTGYEWEIDVYIAPIVSTPPLSGCGWLYPGATPLINTIDIGATTYHGTGTIPERGLGIGGCMYTNYCALWEGDEIAIGLSPIPTNYTVVRVVFRKGNPGVFNYIPLPNCLAPVTATAEIDEFTLSNSCSPREPKAIASCSQPDNKFHFALDHYVNSCTYCANYTNSVAFVGITNW